MPLNKEAAVSRPNYVSDSENSKGNFLKKKIEQIIKPANLLKRGNSKRDDASVGGSRASSRASVDRNNTSFDRKINVI